MGGGNSDSGCLDSTVAMKAAMAPETSAAMVPKTSAEMSAETSTETST